MLNKKGAVSNFVILFVSILVILMFILIAYQVGTSVMDSSVFNNTLTVDANGTAIPSASEAMHSWDLIKTKGFDAMFVIMYFLIHIAELILAGMIPIAGALMIGLNIIILLVLAVLSGMWANILSSIIGAFGLPYLTGTNWIISHFFILEIGFMLILLFVLYKSAGSGG